MEGQNISIEDLRAAVERNDQMIQIKLAIEYLSELIDPQYRDAFREAESRARTVEDMKELLELAKKYIAQQTVMDLLGISV